MKNKSDLKKLYLIDISSLFFRSYYAISFNMKSEKGLPTNALYGVLKMLNQLFGKKAPDYIVCCFDTKEPSFRKELYPEYKANRKEMPEDLEVQVPYLKKMMDCFLIPSWEKRGFEADDLIASLVHQAQSKKWETYIVSSDKDFAQIVDSKTFLYDTMKEVIYDSSGVEEKWGLPPSQIQDYLSLTGDASDNIPGVKGLGPKGAVQLLKSYKNLEDIYKNIEEIKGSLKEKLLRDKEMAFLSRKLIALRKDVKGGESLLKEKRKDFSHFSDSEKQKLKEFLEELSFKSFIKKLFPESVKAQKTEKDSQKKERKIPLNKKDSSNKKTDSRPSSSVDSLRGKVLSPHKKNSPYKSTEPLPEMSSSAPSLKMKALSLEDFKRALPPYAELWIGHYKEDFYLAHEKHFVLLKDLESLADFLDEKWIRYSGHDLKFFWTKLKLKNPVARWDSLIAGHLLSSKSSPSLESLCKKHLNSLEEEGSLSLPQALYREKKLKEEISQCLAEEAMTDLFQNIELPLISVLYDMEKEGILLDLKEISRQSQDLARDIENLEFQIYKLAGEEFNLSSPKQLSGILFDKLNLPRGRKTKTIYSTDSHELTKIKQLNPILPLILEHREFFKLKSTYTDSLISLRDKKTGRIYTEFKQAVASTGRLSSVNPNLQNIPIRTERGRLIRKAFIASPGKKLVSADYSQLELRILAHITGDKNLTKAFEEGQDVHARTASELFNVSLKEVSSDLRRKSKAVNFGIAYGQGAYGLAESLSISRSEAKEIIENYFKKFKKVKDYIETVKEELPRKNYVETLYGRKRFFSPEDLKQPRFRSAVERSAINAPLQGTASDLVKEAMISLNESLFTPIVSQVHDEILFDCPKAFLESDSQKIISIMEENQILKIPLKVNLAVGSNWLSAHS